MTFNNLAKIAFYSILGENNWTEVMTSNNLAKKFKMMILFHSFANIRQTMIN